MRCIESHEPLCRISAFAKKTRGRDMARVRGSHDFHRVILDFKKESSGSVLLLRLCAVGPSIPLLDEKFKMLRFISCVTRPALGSRPRSVAGCWLSVSQSEPSMRALDQSEAAISSPVRYLRPARQLFVCGGRAARAGRLWPALIG